MDYNQKATASEWKKKLIDRLHRCQLSPSFDANFVEQLYQQMLRNPDFSISMIQSTMLVSLEYKYRAQLEEIK